MPTEAIFDRGHLPDESRPVHAWDDEGAPLVLWRNALRSAPSIEGFKEVRERHQIVGAVPGGGWMTEWQDPGAGTSFADPVVAWVVYSNGGAQPIDTDSSGEGMPLEPSVKDRRTYHPDQISDTPLPGEKTSGAEAEHG
ncbi:hypothetical protein [Streptomyces sp. NPDC005485]|uniref:hypothetical protein n=1 Tax=Streptomyces sp. NPDC005485 TaxID=3155591 RepID=UPI0033A5F28D